MKCHAGRYANGGSKTYDQGFLLSAFGAQPIERWLAKGPVKVKNACLTLLMWDQPVHACTEFGPDKNKVDVSGWESRVLSWTPKLPDLDPTAPVGGIPEVETLRGNTGEKTWVENSIVAKVIQVMKPPIINLVGINYYNFNHTI